MTCKVDDHRLRSCRAELELFNRFKHGFNVGVFGFDDIKLEALESF